jgi:hypothetical protein
MTIIDPADARFVTGSPEEIEEARRQWHRQRFAAQVANSALDQLDAADLKPHRFGIVEHAPTGRLYAVRRDELPDLEYANAIAYYVDASGAPRLLEEPPGPQSVQALAEQQANREKRRAAPRPRPAWMR